MHVIVPYLIALSATICYASLSPMAKKIGITLPPFSLIAVSSFIHFTIAGLIAFFYEKSIILEVYPKVEWNWLLVFSLTNLIGYSLYLLALTKMPVAQYQMFGLLAPIIGGMIAVYLLKEPFHMRYILSLVFISIGIFIAIKPELHK